MSIDTAIDRPLLAEIVRKEVNRRHKSVSTFARDHDLPRRNLDRILAADDQVAVSYIERVEGALELPRDGLLSLAQHEWDDAYRAGVDSDLVRWASSRGDAQPWSEPGSRVG